MLKVYLYHLPLVHTGRLREPLDEVPGRFLVDIGRFVNKYTLTRSKCTQNFTEQTYREDCGKRMMEKT